MYGDESSGPLPTFPTTTHCSRSPLTKVEVNNYVFYLFMEKTLLFLNDSGLKIKTEGHKCFRFVSLSSKRRKIKQDNINDPQKTNTKRRPFVLLPSYVVVRTVQCGYVNSYVDKKTRNPFLR